MEALQHKHFSLSVVHCSVNKTTPIRIATSRHPGQVISLSGSWFGNAEDYLGMEVQVNVRKWGSPPEFREGQA